MAITSAVALALSIIALWYAHKTYVNDRELGHAQARAYPAFVPTNVTIDTQGNLDEAGRPKVGKRIGVVVVGEVRNSGQTPARSMSTRFAIVQIETSAPLVPITGLPLKSYPAAAGEIGGGLARDHVVQEPLDIDLPGLIAETKAIRVAGIISGRDVFGKKIESEFDGILTRVGAFIAYYQTTGTIEGGPGIGWQWPQSKDYEK